MKSVIVLAAIIMLPGAAWAGNRPAYNPPRQTYSAPRVTYSAPRQTYRAPARQVSRPNVQRSRPQTRQVSRPSQQRQTHRSPQQRKVAQHKPQHRTVNRKPIKQTQGKTKSKSQQSYFSQSAQPFAKNAYTPSKPLAGPRPNGPVVSSAPMYSPAPTPVAKPTSGGFSGHVLVTTKNTPAPAGMTATSCPPNTRDIYVCYRAQNQDDCGGGKVATKGTCNSPRKIDNNNGFQSTGGRENLTWTEYQRRGGTWSEYLREQQNSNSNGSDGDWKPWGTGPGYDTPHEKETCAHPPCKGRR